MLTQRFSQAAAAAHLIPLEDYRPYPRIEERAEWESLPEELRRLAVGHGEQSLAFDWPALTATRFLDFARTGNRSRYEQLYFERRRVLGRLVLAECVENKGRFVDQIVNGVWCICEESTWVVPAHNGMSRSGQPLPDAFDPSVDLFAADTGALLSWVHYLVGSKLAAVSPIINERIRREVTRRILTPFLTEDIHWMGFGATVNNWNPWCTSNCLASALLIEADPDRRKAMVERVPTILDNWLRDYAPDGGCDEGPGYWNVAGGALFDCLELLRSATGGRLDVYDEPLIAEIGRYIMRVHISRDYFVNFADGNARLNADGCMIYRYGRRIGDDRLAAMGASGFRLSHSMLRTGGWYSFNRVLPEVFAWMELSRCDAGPPHLRDAWMPGIQVMTAREKGGTDRGLYLAAKGGHNAESHNHNDIGNFIVYADGRPMIIDAGVGAYTRETFGPNRYSIWTMQSAYHNLPTINGVMQSPGGQFRAKDVSYAANEGLTELSMDIAGAYRPEACVETWRRVFRLRRGPEACVEIVDEFSLEQPREVTITLLAAPKPETDEEDLIVREPDGAGVRVEFDSRQLSADIETVDITDERLRPLWGDALYRVLLRSKEPVDSGVWHLRIRML